MFSRITLHVCILYFLGIKPTKMKFLGCMSLFLHPATRYSEAQVNSVQRGTFNSLNCSNQNSPWGTKLRKLEGNRRHFTCPPAPALPLSPASFVTLPTSSCCLTKCDPFCASSDREKGHNVTAVPPVPLTLNSFCFKQAGVMQAVTTRTGAGGCSKVEVPAWGRLSAASIQRQFTAAKRLGAYSEHDFLS